RRLHSGTDFQPEQRRQDACATASTFIEFRSVTGVFLQNLARFELVVGLRKPIHLIDNLLQTKMFREPQRPAAERREACAKNHSVISVFGRFDYTLLHTARRFIYHQKNKPPSQVLSNKLQSRIALPI